MLVKDIMSKKVISVAPSDNVQKIISLMKKHHIHEIPIIDNRKLVGMIQAKRLTQKSILDPYKTKVKSIKVSTPAILKPEQELDEAAKLILKTGLRALPVVESKNIVGIVSLHDIINEVSASKLFRQTKAKDVMSSSIIITDDTDMGKARVLMREHNISRLPVVDENGKVKGVVDTFDMLRSIKARERMSSFSMAAEMERMMQIPISTIMNTRPLTMKPDKSLNEVANMIKKYDTSGVIITSNNIPKGVIVLKDLLEFYVSGLKKEGVYYQVVGLSGEDTFITDTVDRMIQDTIKKVSNAYDILFLFVHVKKHKVALRGKTKYSVRVRLKTPKKMYISKAWAWDLRKSIDQSLDQIERMIFKDRKISKDRYIDRTRKRKDMIRRR